MTRAELNLPAVYIACSACHGYVCGTERLLSARKHVPFLSRRLRNNIRVNVRVGQASFED